MKLTSKTIYWNMYSKCGNVNPKDASLVNKLRHRFADLNVYRIHNNQIIMRNMFDIFMYIQKKVFFNNISRKGRSSHTQKLVPYIYYDRHSIDKIKLQNPDITNNVTNNYYDNRSISIDNSRPDNRTVKLIKSVEERSLLQNNNLKRIN